MTLFSEMRVDELGPPAPGRHMNAIFESINEARLLELITLYPSLS